MTNLQRALAEHPNIAPVLPPELQFSTVVHIFDLSSDASPFKNVNFHNTQALTELIRRILQQYNAVIGIGRYAENQHIYQHFHLFINNDTVRSVYLGIDLTVPMHTAVMAPLKRTVHSFNDDRQVGGYGLTIILKYILHGTRCYTLYGHPSVADH